MNLAVIWLLKNFIFFKLFIFRVGCFFGKMYFPRRAGKRTPIIVKSPNVRILSIFVWFYLFPYANSMQKNTPHAFKHVPDLFWRLRDRKTRKKTQHLKKLKTCPEKTARWKFLHNPSGETDHPSGRAERPPAWARTPKVAPKMARPRAWVRSLCQFNYFGG